MGAFSCSIPLIIRRVFLKRWPTGLAPGWAAVAGNFSRPETRNCRNNYETFDSATS